MDAAAFGRERVYVGPFAAMLHPTDPLIYLNYAVPTSEPLPEALGDLIGVFRARGRRPRFEFFASLWPSLEDMLVQHGFEIESRVPVMILTANALTDGPEDAVEMGDLDTLLSFGDCIGEAFGEPMGPDSAASSLVGIKEGRLLGACVMDGDRVVSGGFVVGRGTIAEVAGIGTRPAFRRRGHASRVSRFLCRKFFERGGEIAWLSAGSEEAKAVYSKLGFTEVGVQVNMPLA